ncbi:hypothetical protein [Acutalibacter caecimuris]|uniref:hypothetical protein n=1 Tax=Acutalibacter caecimuris TaxID=3093657 RepID=UPI002AC9C4DC|nr:hypothetical protein [Acutalibacter sp. M00118]
MAYELDTLTDNCYEGTIYLINKFDIRDNKQLVIETAIAYTKPPNWSANLSTVILILRSTSYSPIFFEDIYDWAGTVWTVDVSKKGTIFVPAKDVKSIADRYFRRLKEKSSSQGHTLEQFCDVITDFYRVTNSSILSVKAMKERNQI